MITAPDSFLPSLVGSFSTGASANPTGVLMQAAFTDLKLDWSYVNCEVAREGLAGAVAGAVSMGWQGFNCSMPHKQAVIPMLDDLSDTAKVTNAVNCVTRTDGRLVGHNTDGVGFLHAVADAVDISSCAALIIGSGGAAHAIAIELARAGAATVMIASRNAATSAALASLVERNTNATATAESVHAPLDVGAVQLVVNATPLGSSPDLNAMPLVDWTTAPADLVVADVVFNPVQTAFLRAAESAACRTVDGTGMLVNQAIENVRLWTGERANRAPMRSALETALKL